LRPVLRFTPYAWAKLEYLRDYGPTEVGGFGRSAPGDLLLVEDLLLPQQADSPVTVEFGDEAVADLFDRQIDAGLRPEQFARIWIHTHPGVSALPSSIDERTFTRVFGDCDWALMMILARGGATYARLQLRAGPGLARRLPVAVDYSRPFPGSDRRLWRGEYDYSVVVCDPWLGMGELLRRDGPGPERADCAHENLSHDQFWETPDAEFHIAGGS
jgi:hypothetical protein